MAKAFAVLFSALLLLLAGCGDTYYHAREEQDYDGFTKLRPEYKMIFQRVIRPFCIDCHGPDAESGVDLTSYETMMSAINVPALVVPGSPEDSPLYTDLLDGTMPENGPKMNKFIRQAIYQWILDGAQP